MPPKGTTAISRPVVRFKWVSREFENSDSHLDVHNRKYRFVCIKVRSLFLSSVTLVPLGYLTGWLEQCGDVLSNFTKGSSVRTLFREDSSQPSERIALADQPSAAKNKYHHWNSCNMRVSFRIRASHLFMSR